MNMKAFIARLDCRQLFSRVARPGPRTVAVCPAPQPIPAPAAAVRPRRSERGQTLIEFAFVLPVILVFILLLVDFGIALDRREVLQHAVREGARYAAVGNSVADIKQRTVDQSQGVLNTGNVSVCYVDSDGNGVYGNLGDNVHVSASFTYVFNIGSGEMLSAFGVPVPSIDMTPSGDMRLEKTVSGGTAC